MPVEVATALLIGGPRDGATYPLPERWSHRLAVPVVARISVDAPLLEGTKPEEIHIYEWARFPARWPKSKYTPFIHAGVEYLSGS